jgi:hypothetical protein
MILTIILILSSLVALNFLLLFFSCNKTTKKVDNRKPLRFNTEKAPKRVTNQLRTRPLAATGS